MQGLLCETITLRPLLLLHSIFAYVRLSFLLSLLTSPASLYASWALAGSCRSCDHIRNLLPSVIGLVSGHLPSLKCC